MKVDLKTRANSVKLDALPVGSTFEFGGFVYINTDELFVGSSPITRFVVNLSNGHAVRVKPDLLVTPVALKAVLDTEAAS